MASFVCFGLRKFMSSSTWILNSKVLIDYISVNVQAKVNFSAIFLEFDYSLINSFLITSKHWQGVTLICKQDLLILFREAKFHHTYNLITNFYLFFSMCCRSFPSVTLLYIYFYLDFMLSILQSWSTKNSRGNQDMNGHFVSHPIQNYLLYKSKFLFGNKGKGKKNVVQ